MSTEIIVSLISLVGTLAGTFSGILVANRLSAYRIEQLEKKVEKLEKMISDRFDKFDNNIDDIKERLVITEQSTKSAHHRLDDIVAQLKIKERRT